MESFACGVIGCVQRRVNRRRQRRARGEERQRVLDSEEGGLLEGNSGGEDISKSVQETVPPIKGDKRLRFDRDQHNDAEEGRGEYGRMNGSIAHCSDDSNVDVSECLQTSSQLTLADSFTTDSVDDDPSASDSLLLREVDHRDTPTSALISSEMQKWETEPSRGAQVTTSARTASRHARRLYAPNTSAMKKFFTRKQRSLEVTNSIDSGIVDDVTVVAVQPTPPIAEEETDNDAACSDRTQLVLPTHNRALLDEWRRGKRSAPVVVPVRNPFNLLKRPSMATPDPEQL